MRAALFFGVALFSVLAGAAGTPFRMCRVCLNVVANWAVFVLGRRRRGLCVRVCVCACHCARLLLVRVVVWLVAVPRRARPVSLLGASVCVCDVFVMVRSVGCALVIPGRADVCDNVVCAHGHCLPGTGLCVCEPPWRGDSCDLIDCGPKNCSGSSHGSCVNGTCACVAPYSGPDCASTGTAQQPRRTSTAVAHSVL